MRNTTRDIYASLLQLFKRDYYVNFYCSFQITIVGLDLNYSTPFNRENFIMNDLEIQTNFTIEV